MSCSWFPLRASPFPPGYFFKVSCDFFPLPSFFSLYSGSLLLTSQDEYTILNSKHAIGIHGFVLVYSVASRKSFDMVQIVYDKIINFCGLNQIPCVIVGSKTDLSTRYVPGLRACVGWRETP